MNAEIKARRYTLIRYSDCNHVLTLLTQHSVLIAQHFP
jgi:hypothetical protein